MAKKKDTSTKPQSEIDALPTLEMMFMYRGIDAKNKVYYVWIDNEGKERFLDYKVKNADPGMWFSFPLEGTSIYVSCAKYAGRRERNSAMIMEWQLKDRVVQQKLNAQRNIQAVALNGPLQKAVAQIRLGYRQLPASQRTQFIAWLVSELHK